MLAGGRKALGQRFIEFAGSLRESLRAHAFNDIDCRHDDMLLPEGDQKRVRQDNTAIRLSSQVGEMLHEVTEVGSAERCEGKPCLQFQKVFTAGFGALRILRP